MNGSSLVIATDPDADRFQLAEKNDGSWHIFTGNEMGALLAWWKWYNWRRLNPDKSAEDVYIINSAVSSKIARTIAETEGFKYEETLTGFKWMANKAATLRSQGKTVLMAWEESIGYMPGDALDKDGVITSAIFADYASFLHAKNMTFQQQLAELYANTLKVVGLNYFRFQLLPVNSSNNMITFTLENGSMFTIRSSGTEPKVKFYLEVISKKDEEEANKQLQVLIKAIIETFLVPEKYELIWRS
ncbi:unnamed protein product [Soboliphyme baturini]|uniref:PGM_PMM_III domain-containing protein n=1 Tax=Soboliphyme baturini TaxID=241478 RepID=A0A183J7E8_9BILA|nr:unnamed protein product [Soboliphyme baturini]